MPKPRRSKVGIRQKQKQSQKVVVNIHNGAGGKKKRSNPPRPPAVPRNGVSSYAPQVISIPFVEMYAPQHSMFSPQQGTANRLAPVSAPAPAPKSTFTLNDDPSILSSNAFAQTDMTFHPDEIVVETSKQRNIPRTPNYRYNDDDLRNATPQKPPNGLKKGSHFNTIYNSSKQTKIDYFRQYPDSLIRYRVNLLTNGLKDTDLDEFNI